jgi:hypothetical protein
VWGCVRVGMCVGYVGCVGCGGGGGSCVWFDIPQTAHVATLDTYDFIVVNDNNNRNAPQQWVVRITK